MTTRAPIRVATWPGLDSGANPFIEDFCAALERNGAIVQSIHINDLLRTELSNVDHLVLHWPQFIYKDAPSRWARLSILVRFTMMLWRLRRAGVRVTWIVHDLEPHDMSGWKMRVFWLQTRRLLGLLVSDGMTLAPSTIEPAIHKVPGLRKAPMTAAWHPRYEGAALDPATRAAVREALGYQTHHRVVGYVGSLRGYKGFGALVEAFTPQRADDVRLLLGGTPNRPHLIKELRAQASGDRRVRMIFEELSDTAYRDLVNACDLCVFPYLKYFHSGAMIFALSAGRPILTARTPFAEGLAEALGPGWVRLYDAPLTPQILADALKRPPPPGSPDLSDFDADRFAQTLLLGGPVVSPGSGSRLKKTADEPLVAARSAP